MLWFAALSLFRTIIIASVETLFIAKGCVCFLPIAILLSLFIAWLKPYNSIYSSYSLQNCNWQKTNTAFCDKQSLNWCNNNFSKTERARQIITHAYMARDFNFLCLCYVNYSSFHGTIMTCTVNLFIKWRQPCLKFLVMSLYAFHLGQIISTVLGQVDHIWRSRW